MSEKKRKEIIHQIKELQDGEDLLVVAFEILKQTVKLNHFDVVRNVTNRALILERTAR